MSIQNIGAQGAARTYVQNADVARAGGEGEARKAHHHAAAQKADSVTLSSDARSLAAARDAVQSAPDVREHKVAEIKQSLADGTYSVNASVLARKMINSSQNA
jgi:negative regulator of flagellin synthesis FlgM